MTSTSDGGAVATLDGGAVATINSAPEAIVVPAWAWLVLALALALVYGLTMENGATLRAGATVLHELFHDGRHFLGVPCH